MTAPIDTNDPIIPVIPPKDGDKPQGPYGKDGTTGEGENQPQGPYGKDGVTA